ncbi:Transmembrane and coiled-coil domain-containing protein 4 [Heracleum sosnowskyi]|uniref:Transmembrane and coiled-coil domain-containing protein 4 n=1 Tax=Heracleum sosnowskyi TaxID=360622 RepID=A0AAD8H140_9APIA|nr:Transmembrane and coiled-coil domain-containing protein 4 [Heracleum sosnowskyi]
MPSMLSPPQKYAAGGLIALSLNQVLINKTNPLSSISDDNYSDPNVIQSRYVDRDYWLQHYAHLLRLIFRSLDIEEKSWPGLERAFRTDSSSRNVRAFLKLLAEDCNDDSQEIKEQEIALMKAVDNMVSTLQASVDYRSKKEKHRQYVDACREKLASDTQSHYETEKKGHHDPVGDYVDQCREQMSPGSQSDFDMERKSLLDPDDRKEKKDSITVAPMGSGSNFDENPFEEVSMLSYQKKVALLYELLSACLAVTYDANHKNVQRRKGYDARHRSALRLLTAWLNINWITMEAIETIIASSAIACLKEGEFKEQIKEQLKEDGTHGEKDTWANWKRGSMIGAAALTGGTIFAVTGGLAAPGIAAGVGALAPVSFHVGATAAATHLAVAASLGAAGAGLSGMKMASRIGSLEDFEFKPVGENHEHGRLAVEILISGFVFVEEDYIRPWEGQANNSERYALQWESKNLIAVSTAIQDWLTTQLTITAMKQGAMFTVLHSLVSALAWPTALLNVLDLIDSKWAIAIDRSDQAGKLLAEEVLLKGLHGQRPVTLIGFSLGARVIFKCLETLAKLKCDAQLVERVVLLGSPLSIKDENWDDARKVVSGRFVNAYSTNDWMLGVVFRASLLSKGLAGMQAVDIPGIENIDVTEFVEGHSSYLWTTQRIMEKIQLDAYFPSSDAIFMDRYDDNSCYTSARSSSVGSSMPSPTNKQNNTKSAKSSPTCGHNKTVWDV